MVCLLVMARVLSFSMAIGFEKFSLQIHHVQDPTLIDNFDATVNEFEHDGNWDRDKIEGLLPSQICNNIF